jgi:hypothetical protein
MSRREYKFKSPRPPGSCIFTRLHILEATVWPGRSFFFWLCLHFVHECIQFLVRLLQLPSVRCFGVNSRPAIAPFVGVETRPPIASSILQDRINTARICFGNNFNRWTRRGTWRDNSLCIQSCKITRVPHIAELVSRLGDIG